ncbi:Hypothetical predicted protein [Mytilus galloprovincialis]|uniref:Uncharacterized protein n=1 Tax=Mytilus galloprovincialis TaxID=29158 RepID=A0A8B6D3K6_MYTGA|nr:Hypothetical predicted protein [Mytilus galloprovincialis]
MAPTKIDCTSTDNRFTTTYLPAVGASAGKKASLKKISRPTTVQRQVTLLVDRCGQHLITTTRHPSGIDTFFDQGSDVPNPRELDPSRKNLMVNLMVFDDLMLRKQNTCKDNVDCFYLCQNYFTLPRQSIRENANFPCLFQQNAKNIDHIRHDHCNDLTKEQYSLTLCVSIAGPSPMDL